MTAAFLADAWGLWRRHRDLLVRVAAPWLFLPPFALALLTAPPPPLPATRDEESGCAWAEALVGWAGQEGGWYLLAHLVGLAGVAGLHALLLSGLPARAAMSRGLATVPRLALATLVTAPPVVLGLSLWLVPGFYVMGRLVLVAPAMVVERRGVLAAIGASVRRTRGHGFALTALVAVPLVGGWLAGRPFLMLDRLLREGEPNPVAIVMVDAGAAAAAFAGGLAQVLVAVAAYRALARKGI